MHRLPGTATGVWRLVGGGELLTAAEVGRWVGGYRSDRKLRPHLYTSTPATHHSLPHRVQPRAWWVKHAIVFPINIALLATYDRRQEHKAKSDGGF